MKGLNWLHLFIVLIFGFSTAFAGKKAQGIVFDDRNGNGRFDSGEKGIAGVAVSNQREVVQTDNKGRFKLDIDDRTIIFITKPAGYEVPLNEWNLPQFYYLHFPSGSPEYLNYPGIAPTGKLPKKIFFPLQKTTLKKRFSAVISGDPQPATNSHVDYFRDDIITEMLQEKSVFYLALGDIVWDDLTLYGRYTEAVAQLQIPAYNVHGNHDMNLHSPNDEFSAETFKRWFGPEYFSFDYGDVHFIILDDVGYQGWRDAEKLPGKYSGFLPQKQLQWLENDLKFVAQNKLVVLAMHIPIATELIANDANNLTNRAALFAKLADRKKLLTLSGHTHATEALKLGKSHGWQGQAEFLAINPGAACGAWWSGPQDIRGLPEALCTDGSPNGYYVFDFDGAQYSYRFQAANHAKNDQIRISFPRGLVQQSDSSMQKITVNFFYGSREALVKWQIDDGPQRIMDYKIMPDPFVADYMAGHTDSIVEWIRNSNKSTHIWQADFPQNLQPGLHTLHISVRDQQGKSYHKSAIFEIAEF